MADSMLVRFDDETAREVRERARAAGKSITAFLNDAVRTYLDELAASEGVEGALAEARRLRFAARLADAVEAVRSLDVTQSAGVGSALGAIVDCLELIPILGERVHDPVTWDQFKYSKLNPTGGDREARGMFAKDYREIESRPWIWYRDSHRDDAAAKEAWLRQRRRYGLPVPPESVD